MPTQAPKAKKIEVDVVGDNPGYLRFSDITKDKFHRLLDYETTKHLHYFYHFNEQKLRVQIPEEFHDSLTTQLFLLICDKLKLAGLLNIACLPNLSPSVKLGNVAAAKPHACWRPLNNKDFTVFAEVGKSEQDNEVADDARRWIDYPGSSCQICLVVELTNPDIIKLSVWSPKHPFNPNRQLRRSHTSASITELATINRGNPDPVVQFKSFTAPKNIPTEIRLPVVAFTGYQFPSGSDVKFGDTITLTEEDLKEFGRLYWIQRNTHKV
ncbi:hypothetical protein N7528_004035 [Penicillium herquei]|nr:hypothetical protein N7528_004035 [Penicillium herquei]